MDATDLIICLSDDLQNFRKDIYPAYKAKRRTSVRPIHLYDVKEWFGEKYDTRVYPRLEGDDVMGILATEPHTGDRIIVSADKDMMTVPSLLYRPQEADLGVMSISHLDSIRFLFWQTIVGDATDGYPGCPGVGKFSVYAQDVLEAEDEIEAWDEVLMAYASKGLDESHAVIQCNLARILVHGAWDGKRVTPWVPPIIDEVED